MIPVATIYDKVSGDYDSIYTSEACMAEDSQVAEELVNALRAVPAGGTVLDLGCGTGKFLELLPDAGGLSYLGVDPSRGMLDLAASRYPDQAFACMDSDEAVAARLFFADAVVALFGSASYFSIESLRKIAQLRPPVVFLMTMDPGYLPPYYAAVDDGTRFEVAKQYLAARSEVTKLSDRTIRVGDHAEIGLVFNV